MRDEAGRKPLKYSTFCGKIRKFSGIEFAKLLGQETGKNGEFDKLIGRFWRFKLILTE